MSAGRGGGRPTRPLTSRIARGTAVSARGRTGTAGIVNDTRASLFTQI